MTLFCKYKNILGESEQGFHKSRLFKTDNFEGFARNDIIGVFVIAIIIVIIMSYFNKYNWIEFGKKVGSISFLLFVIGFIMHLLFCVKTPLTKHFLN